MRHIRGALAWAGILVLFAILVVLDCIFGLEEREQRQVRP